MYSLKGERDLVILKIMATVFFGEVTVKVIFNRKAILFETYVRLKKVSEIISMPIETNNITASIDF